MSSPFHRVTIIVCDSLGIGEMPDAAEYGDAGSDTLGHILASREVKIPNLQQLGLCNIRELPVTASSSPIGCYGRAALASRGKDTTTGHWEMAGIITTATVFMMVFRLPVTEGCCRLLKKILSPSNRISKTRKNGLKNAVFAMSFWWPPTSLRFIPNTCRIRFRS